MGKLALCMQGGVVLRPSLAQTCTGLRPLNLVPPRHIPPLLSSLPEQMADLGGAAVTYSRKPRFKFHDGDPTCGELQRGSQREVQPPQHPESGSRLVAIRARGPFQSPRLETKSPNLNQPGLSWWLALNAQLYTQKIMKIGFVPQSGPKAQQLKTIRGCAKITSSFLGVLKTPAPPCHPPVIKLGYPPPPMSSTYLMTPLKTQIIPPSVNYVIQMRGKVGPPPPKFIAWIEKQDIYHFVTNGEYKFWGCVCRHLTIIL